MGIVRKLKQASEKVDQIIREEVDEPRERDELAKRREQKNGDAK